MKAVILEGDAVNPGDISWDPVTTLVETTIYENTTEENKWEHLEGFDIVMTNKVKIGEDVLERFPQIKYIGVNATGYNVVDLEAARRRGIPVTNIPAYSTDAVVQMTWAMILDLSSTLTLHNESVHRGEWTSAESFCYWLKPIVELKEKTLGVYGFGSIGRKVAQIGKAFGMKILVHTAHPEKYVAFADEELRFCDSETIFCESDVLTFHCPLTDETTGIVNSRTLAMMKPEAFLINVSRGPVVVERELAWALDNGVIAGAALDVIAEEPMRKDNPLLQAPNLLITPHIAWASKEARERLISIAADNLAAFLKGEPIHVVNGKDNGFLRKQEKER